MTNEEHFWNAADKVLAVYEKWQVAPLGSVEEELLDKELASLGFKSAELLILACKLLRSKDITIKHQKRTVARLLTPHRNSRSPQPLIRNDLRLHKKVKGVKVTKKEGT